MNESSCRTARLVLEDGSFFEGSSFGSEKSSAGEVVFNTGMVGYNEALTDPSYEGQILCFTYPLIGNYGVPSQEKQFGLKKFFESEEIHVSGLIVNSYSHDFNHWNAKGSLSEWLKKEKVPAITGIDTRALTKRLREKGVMLGKIVIGKEIPFFDPNKENLAKKVTCFEPVVYGEGKKKVLLIDCGAKNNIIRSLLKRDTTVIRSPLEYDFFEKKIDFDAVVVSSGPGDPKTCSKTISLIKKVVEKEIPLFGICLGHQLLSLAIGADTYKLKFGHRSQNQPSVLAGTNKCFITTQNHGFAVKKNSLPSDWLEWFSNLNDGTNEGIRHKNKTLMSVQFHPEASPGPTDTGFLFDEFLKEVK